MQQLPFSSTTETKGATCTLPKDAFRPASRKKVAKSLDARSPFSPRNKTSRLSGDRSPIIGEDCEYLKMVPGRLTPNQPMRRTEIAGKLH
ncbi:hypothetical protein CDAR_437731 [Caerostris darwini]|uniref:Uncharacterized protein n=1 Tax=Caerostris darwini TaxID=1538125 RepID=A0AAV4NT64_9ARAC|nr:hypothetical protein CDAR_437731 [Caerostris darwini]